MKFFLSYIFIIFILSLFIFITLNLNIFADSSNSSNSQTSDLTYYFSNSTFNWPIPGIYRITSPFGPRRSPTGRSIF